ncbi:hypothetical protein [Viridibacillus sp. FSL H8-0123]|uniref:hypothetical protein n=1 Tax=Viridibacillus sp. FSL H8-0123 TaxID=1928922 RepID=UPI00096DFF66|nr:hypothetical protein [Viridibacillus sp. FSL H8-0123]OMC83345.1 hypothetical protein BK130_07295 [Viridibacillus sp. FSL H8-0123]
MVVDKKNYKLVTDAKKIMNVFNKNNIFSNLDNDLTILYIGDFKNDFNIDEFELMKETLKKDLSAKLSDRSSFFSLYSILLALLAVLVTTYISITSTIETKNIVLLVTIITVFLYMFIMMMYNTIVGISQDRIIKIINHIELLIRIKKEDL